MRRNQHEDTRFVMALLLPERSCCAAFCAFGAILGSLHRKAQRISWSEFEKLRTGERVHLKIRDSKGSTAAEAELSGWQTLQGCSACRLRILSPRRLADTTQFVFRGNFQRFELSRTPHLATREQHKLGPVGDFLRSLHSDFDESWIRSEEAECLLLTNQAQWNRDLAHLSLESSNRENGGAKAELKDLLVTSDQTAQRAKTQLRSPGGEIPNTNCPPVAVLDGARALKSWETLPPSNVLVLLGQSEYQESEVYTLQELAAARTEPGENLTDVPDELPSATEMTIISLARYAA